MAESKLSEISKRALDILLVEDNPGDIRLTQEIFKECKVDNRLHVVTDGEEAIRFLMQEDVYREAKRPHLILLDLNLPRKDGREVLAQIKTDPRFRTIPVVILTTSKAQEDILESYHLHANCYILKPVDLDRFLNVVQYLGDFWLGIVELPTP